MTGPIMGGGAPGFY